MDEPKKIKFGFYLIAGILAASTFLIFFGWLAEEVLEAHTVQFDEYVRAAIHRLASPSLTVAMEVFSFLGSVAFLLGLTMFPMGLFFYFHHPRAAMMLGVTMAGDLALDITLKYSFHRPRPVAFFGTSPGSYSFPSGHAMGSMCFYGALALILSARISTWAGRAFLY